MPTAADDYDRIARAGRGGLWRKAEQRLQSLLDDDPENLNALTQLAELRRRDGDLAAAADLYHRVTVIEPGNHRARFLRAVLSDKTAPVPNLDEATTPVPFLLIDDFLPPDERDRLLEMAWSDVDRYDPLPVRVSEVVGPEAVGPEAVAAEAVAAEAMPEVRRQRGRGHDPLAAGILEPYLGPMVPLMAERLGMTSLTVAAIVAEPTITPHGGFGRAHTDDVGRAVISFAYYLHRPPKTFLGGDLLLYDTAISTYGFDPRHFTKIDHIDNRLVAFPSRCFHEVTPVDSSSSDPTRSRLSVAGIIQTVTPKNSRQAW